jgi:hypothetical protein
MKKALVTIGLWVLITIPVTFIALLLDAYIVSHLTFLSTALVDALTQSTAINRPMILEWAERLPEIAGMFAGMLLILISVWVVRTEPAKNR